MTNSGSPRPQDGDVMKLGYHLSVVINQNIFVILPAKIVDISCVLLCIGIQNTAVPAVKRQKNLAD